MVLKVCSLAHHHLGFVSNISTWATLQTYRVRNSGDEAQLSVFQQAVWVVPIHNKV